MRIASEHGPEKREPRFRRRTLLLQQKNFSTRRSKHSVDGPWPGPKYADAAFVFAFIAVPALIGVAAWLVRRFATNRLGANPARSDASSRHDRRRRRRRPSASGAGPARQCRTSPDDRRPHRHRCGTQYRPSDARPRRDGAAAAVGERAARIAPLPDAGWSHSSTRQVSAIRGRRHLDHSRTACRSRRRARRVPLSPTNYAAGRRRRRRNAAPIRWLAFRRSRWAAGRSRLVPARPPRTEPMMPRPPRQMAKFVNRIFFFFFFFFFPPPPPPPPPFSIKKAAAGPRRARPSRPAAPPPPSRHLTAPCRRRQVTPTKILPRWRSGLKQPSAGRPRRSRRRSRPKRRPPAPPRSETRPRPRARPAEERFENLEDEMRDCWAARRRLREAGGSPA